MNVDKELRRLAKAEKAIAARDRKLAALQDEQVQARGASDAAKEQLALTMLRQRGVFNLSAGQLMALLAGITPAVVTVHGAVNTSAPPLQVDENGGVATPAVPGSVDVTVKFSSNCSKAKRKLLRRAKLTWNGKDGRWIGRVERTHLAELRAVFGERLAIEPAGEAGVFTPASAEPIVEADANHTVEALPDARQVASGADAGVSSGEAGEAVQGDIPGVSGEPADDALPPVRPRMPARPVPLRPAH
jgi:hypothetical protein